MAERTAWGNTTRHYGALYSAGLPSEQHAALVGRQKIEQLYERRGSEASTSTSTCTTSYGSRFSHYNLSKEQRLRRSEVKSLTRQALGSSFTPEYDYHAGSYVGREPPAYGGQWDYYDGGEAIPQKYINEFNRMWHEDDEDNDAERYVADMMPNAPWHQHEPIRPLYTATGELTVLGAKHRAAPEPQPLRRFEMSVDSHVAGPEYKADGPCGPQLVSRFSFDVEKTKRLASRRKAAVATVAKHSESFVKGLAKCTKPAVHSDTKMHIGHSKTCCTDKECTREMLTSPKSPFISFSSSEESNCIIETMFRR
ncbi:hypothetical protein K458DRAFT_397446 [Lentithecium fluviatile CBS 122367]|uniref:Uncharacterized protein n=1 Tax=Lentithecium fluviatile CBS 122367 TaxID=1168545 RepID=A0A6G1ICN6_9PLEO|nr:hypothetical protein K458DRAFT_397446 [Lentithecium fluviatile CBS 122367]